MHRWVWVVALTPALFAQSAPQKRLEFEVASIRPSASSEGRVDVGVHIDGSQVRCTSLSVKEYIRMAYQVKDYQVSGPDWLSSDRFDIAAKLPAGATREQFRTMLQSLLQDRFQMKLHHEKKEFPVYALTVGKGGPKMKEEDAPEGNGSAPVNITASGARAGTSLGNGASFTAADDKFVGTKLTTTNMADLLARYTDRPIVDRTELKGRYSFTMEFSPEDFRAMRIRSALEAGIAVPPRALRLLQESSGDALFGAVEKLGLKLESSKAPLDVLEIDHIEHTPSEN